MGQGGQVRKEVPMHSLARKGRIDKQNSANDLPRGNVAPNCVGRGGVHLLRGHTVDRQLNFSTKHEEVRVRARVRLRVRVWGLGLGLGLGFRLGPGLGLGFRFRV